jgi:hypothetical protein
VAIPVLAVVDLVAAPETFDPVASHGTPSQSGTNLTSPVCGSPACFIFGAIFRGFLFFLAPRKAKSAGSGLAMSNGWG